MSYLLKQMGIAIVVLAGILCGCAPQEKSSARLKNKPLASSQAALLRTAFDIATSIPLYPHIKDRSRAQEQVVDASLLLDQPEQALEFIGQINNWRQGMGYADYAFYSVKHGVTNGVPEFLHKAKTISLAVTDQEWRRDRISVRIAQAYLLMGDQKQVNEFSSNIDVSESGKVEQVRSNLCTEENLDQQIAQLDSMIATQNYDLILNSLFACAGLFDQFYAHTDARSRFETKIKASWEKLPYTVRIDLLVSMAEAALKNNDSKNALRLTDEANEMVTGVTWSPVYQVPLMARVSELKFRVGDCESARAGFQEALKLFDENKADIVNIDKADALIPLAEAFYVTGDQNAALAVYKQAVEASVENPNSRPQAEDLVAICLSMAVKNVEPDEVLWNRIKEFQDALGDPW